MGLRVLINPKEAEGHPKEMFFVGLVYSVVSAAVASVISTRYASLLMLFFTVIATLPIFFSVIKLETRRDEDLNLSEYTLLAGHWKAVKFFIFLFLGFVAGYIIWFFLPFGAESAFSIQVETISEINLPTGQFISKIGDIHYIFWSNFQLLLFSIILSVLFGAGVILILAWNASVLAAAMGLFVQNVSGTTLGVIHLIPTAIFRYLIHGTLEMTSYFIGGLVGGILFIEIIRHKRRKIKHVAIDVGMLFSIAALLLYVAAWVEIAIISLF